jgi:hypothetical protein
MLCFQDFCLMSTSYSGISSFGYFSLLTEVLCSSSLSEYSEILNSKLFLFMLLEAPFLSSSSSSETKSMFFIRMFLWFNEIQ